MILWNSAVTGPGGEGIDESRRLPSGCQNAGWYAEARRK